MRRQEDASFRRRSSGVPAEAVLGAVGEAFGIDAGLLRQRQYDCVARAVAVLLLGRHAGMNQRDAAAYLGMGTGSAACRQLKRLRDRLASDPALRERVHRIGAALEQRQGGRRTD